MKPVYYDIWQDYASLLCDYPDAPTERELVYAGYTYEDYNGDAIVIFVRERQWYENNDGHCSCYGLENWSPEKTHPQAILMRKGWPGLHEAVNARLSEDAA